MQAVLVLDAHAIPLRISHWREVLLDTFLGKVEVLDYHANQVVRGVTRDYPLPSVVRTLRYFRRDRMTIKFSRLNIYARDAFTCQYCGHAKSMKELNFDHVIPRGQGGTTRWDNIVTACIVCNLTKGNRTPQQAGMPLLSRPKKPFMLPSVTQTIDVSDIPAVWHNYWHIGLEP